MQTHNVVKTDTAYSCTLCGEAHGDGDGFIGQPCPGDAGPVPADRTPEQTEAYFQKRFDETKDPLPLVDGGQFKAGPGAPQPITTLGKATAEQAQEAMDKTRAHYAEASDCPDCGGTGWRKLSSDGLLPRGLCGCVKFP